METTKNRIRGLHRGTAGHKPDCNCPPCKAHRFVALTEELTNTRADLQNAREALANLGAEHDDLQAARTQTNAVLNAVYLALPLAWRPAGRAKLTESIVLFAKGWDDLTVKQREVESELTEAHAALRLAKKSIEGFQADAVSQAQRAENLLKINERLTPRLPLWSRTLFFIVGALIIGTVCNYAGYQAGSVALRGGASR